ncbi:MAG: hypothetical protein IJT56_00500 [Clostridia bacterium]|nr:hypothetical protein [Clostridia bacterium]
MKKRPAALLAADILVFAVCLASPCVIDIAAARFGSDKAYIIGAAVYAGVWSLAWLYAALSRAAGLRLASLTLWLSSAASLALNIIFGSARSGPASLPRLAAYVTAVYYTRPVASLFGEPQGGPRGWCALACAALTAVFSAAYMIMALLWKRGERYPAEETAAEPQAEKHDMNEKIDENPYTEDD